MTRIFICGALLAAVLSFVVGMSGKRVRPDNISKSEGITVFLTGSELGELKPCGCSGGQLGGFDRRGAVLGMVPRSRRLVVDTGGLVKSNWEQDLIKFNIMWRAFGMLDYDLVNLQEQDLEIARNIGLFSEQDRKFSLISSSSGSDANVVSKFSRQFVVRGKKLTVTIASVDGLKTDAERIAKLFGDCRDKWCYNIMIVNSCEGNVLSWAKESGVVDCVVCPSEGDEPKVHEFAEKKPMAVSVGRLGKYVGRLDIGFGGGGKKLKAVFSSAAVSENLPKDESLVDLYKGYQQMVKESGLLEKHGRFGLPGINRYAGSKACENCHSYEYEKWSQKAHAIAFKTLEEAGSDYDPECVVCHVVGLNYESGFISPEKTPELENVGCENCHGPSSEHSKTNGIESTGEPKSQCMDCHTPENSAKYAGNEQDYFKKIIHWREPNSVGNVKEKED